MITLHGYDSFDVEQYMELWFFLSQCMHQNSFSWTCVEDTDHPNEAVQLDEDGNPMVYQYMSTSLRVVSPAFIEQCKQASNAVFQLYQSTFRALYVMYQHKQYIELFECLQIPHELLSVAFCEMRLLFSYIARIDFIINETDIKMIEMNCDTPAGIVEASVGNEIICNHYGYSNPTSIYQHITAAWIRILEEYAISSEDTLYFTSYDTPEEDKQTAMFHFTHCPHLNKRYLPVSSLFVAENGVYTLQGEKITYLYRYYPLEFLYDDVDDKGKGLRIGLQFIDHIRTGRIQVINPPSSFLMQNKNIMAIIWHWFDQCKVYSDMEREWIQAYIPRTYWKADYFLKHNLPYVAKPVFGREGGGVSIFTKDNHVQTEDRTPYYYNQQKIYQEYVPMPSQDVSTWDGIYHGKLLVGSHIIGGQFAGLYHRVGEDITGNLSMWMGYAVEP